MSAPGVGGAGVGGCGEAAERVEYVLKMVECASSTIKAKVYICIYLKTLF